MRTMEREMKTNKPLSLDPTLDRPHPRLEFGTPSPLDSLLVYAVRTIIRNVHRLRPSSLETQNEIDLHPRYRTTLSLALLLKILNSLVRLLDLPSTLPHLHLSFLLLRSSSLPPMIPPFLPVLPVLPLSHPSLSLTLLLVPSHLHLLQRSRLSKRLIHFYQPLPLSQLRTLRISMPSSLTTPI